MEQLHQALKGYSCLDYFNFNGERLTFEYPGIEVKFTIRKYADLFLVKVDGKEVYYNADPSMVIDYVVSI